MDGMTLCLGLGKNTNAICDAVSENEAQKQRKIRSQCGVACQALERGIRRRGGLPDARYGTFTVTTVVEAPNSVAFVVPAHQMKSFAGQITFSSFPSHLGQGTLFRCLPRIW